MKFAKMHGCGNDYIVVDGFRQKIEDIRLTADRLCLRKYGIGADGLILLEASPSVDAKMRIFNSDGSEAEMCGNGIRCAARFLIVEGYAQSPVSLETAAGLRVVSACTLQGGTPGFEVDMGAPVINDRRLLTFQGAVSISEIEGTPVSMGNPHFVVFVDALEDFPVAECGSLIEKSSSFPEGTNVEFARILDETALVQRTWERGVGETLACGTGASAVAAVAIRRGWVKSPLTVKLTGGDVGIRWDGKGSIFLSGEAVEVFRGEI